MTENTTDAVELRNWLVANLCTRLGCEADEIDLDASLNDVGVGSRDALELSGELAELLGRSVSPVDFWQNPTINALVGFLTAPDSDTSADSAAASAGRGSLDEPIAVVGLGCRFPGRISATRGTLEVPLGRQSARSARSRPSAGSPSTTVRPKSAAALARTTRWGSFLDDIDAFDAEFFEISLREAAKMDPQQRLLLEVAWEALEHAGIPANSLRRSQTGVFVGACFSEYGYLAAADLPTVDAWSNTGGALSIIANRLSYFLDLRGPSVSVDTACSSSLVACAPGVPEPANGRLRTGHRRRCEPAVVTCGLPRLRPGRVRCRRPVSATRSTPPRTDSSGVRAAASWCSSGSVMPSRDGDRVLGGGAGFGGQPGRPVQWSDGTEPGSADGGSAFGVRPGGREPRTRWTTSRPTAPARLLGDPIEARALGTVLGRGRRSGRTSADRCGQVESRSPGGGGRESPASSRRCWPCSKGQIPANLRYQEPESAHPVRPVAAESRCRAPGVAFRATRRAGRACRRSASAARMHTW